MAEAFKKRMADAISAKGPLCAGVDPSPKLLSLWGLADDAKGLAAFSSRCVEAFADVAAALKANVAFFERFGSAGITALEYFLGEARDAGVLVIADAKRGDISSTNAAYADAWLRDGPLASDALTVVPYLGIGGLAPFVDAAAESGRGVFVVIRSSNPEGRTVQSAIASSGDTLEAELLRELEDPRYRGCLGAVIGVTKDAEPIELPSSGFFLAPGLGAQGASTEDLTALFSNVPATSVLVNLSRSLLESGPDPSSLREAARHAASDLSGAFCPPS